MTPRSWGLAGALSSSSEFIVVEDANMVVETLKPAYEGDAFVCRMYEARGGWRRTWIRFPLLDSEQWDMELVDLMERSTGKGISKKADGKLAFELMFDAFELTTVLVKRRS
jgi:alpha-mannosidase